MTATLRELLRPVPDEHLTRLAEQMVRAVRASTLGLLGVHLAFTLVDLVEGDVDRVASLAASLALAALIGALHLVARRPAALRHAEALGVATAFSIVGAIAAVSRWLDPDAVASLPSIVLLLAAFFPWRPGWTLLCTAAIALLPAVVDLHHVPLGRYVLTTLTNGALGMLANQMHRRLWLELEEGRARAELAQRQLVAADRMSSLGQMVAGIAHELKTPTAAASHAFEQLEVLADELRRSVGHPDVTEADLREIADEVESCAALGLRSVARTGRYLQALRTQTTGLGEVRPEPFVVADRLGQALVLVEHAAQRARVAVELDVPADLEVVGDPGKLDQVVLNLVSNAVEASAGAGSRVRVSGARAPDGVRLVVEDDGPGIPPALRERVFEPLFTTRPGTGTGLGLPICRDLVHAAYGGRLELAPSERGARFELWLPDGGALAMARPAWEPASTDPAVAAAA